METNVLSHYQNGASIENILAGLAYSIAINYINRVVGTKKIGNKIFFQGAVAFNKAVVAAFENYLGKQIIVPENHEVTGAIGTAIRALENHVEHSNFRGFDVIANIKYSQSSFECGGCPNMCEIKKVTSEGSKSLFYGGRCEKYEKKNTQKTVLEDLFLQRDEILLNSYSRSKKNPPTSNEEGRLKVGLPFTMLTYEFYPFWDAFFSEMGIELVLSDKTNRKIINDGLGYVVAETCFPIKVMLGHIQNLLDKGVDYIFVPSIRDMPCDSKKIEGTRTGSYPCPFVQGLSTFVKASIPVDAGKILDPLVNFSFKEYLKNDQLQKLGAKFGKSKKLINDAVKAAYKAQEVFYRDIKRAGEKVLDNLKEDEFAAVIIARPYNSCDANISMDIPGKLRDLGIQAIPLDYLSVDNVDLFSQWPNMYWEFGDRILSAVDIIKKDKRLFPVYITNFGCGPDSFIMQFFEREIDRPFLKIEVDEHTAGAGVITRCEAFYDSLSNIKKLKNGYSFKEKKTEIPVPQFKRKDKRVLYIPYMGDGAYAIQAAFQSGGIEAEIMMSDYETLEIGRKHTLGKECYPYILTTGDILKTLKYNDPSRCAFLMPLTHGPCRFGQYNQMQKILLKELGYPDVPIISPGAPESSQFYKEYDMQGKKGVRLFNRAMAGTFTIDYLTKYLHGTRPYEVNKGQTEQVYNSLIGMVSEKLKDPGNEKVISSMASIMSLAEKEFSGIAANRTPKPLIGIVGEIYVRNHPFSNNEIIKMVENLGGQAQIPDIGEWAYHTNATSKLDNSIKQKDLYFKILSNIKTAFSFNGNGSNGNESNGNGENMLNFSRGLKFNVANKFLNKMLHRYHRLLEYPVKDTDLIDLEESDIYEIWDNAEPYIIKWFGEAALSVGKSIHWIKKGADGIINVLPFTCMPGTMVTAISKSLREEYKVPWLNLAFDGLEQGTTDTRLEAFLYQAKQHKEEKLDKAEKQHKEEKLEKVR
jgi:predicted nucleotide-binding protein (sugar kinase/HSP70/actin superfamily)